MHVNLQDSTIVSMITILLQTILMVVCARGFSKIKMTKYAQIKKTFFLWMGFSAACDIPRYAWCLGQCIYHRTHLCGHCYGDEIGFKLTYALHSAAMNGFCVCLGLPVIIFDSMLRGYEPDNLFNFVYTTTSKKLWHCTIIINLIYGAIMFVFLINSKTFDDFLSNFETPTMWVYVLYTMFIVMAWLFVGFKLRTLVQSYSRQASGMVLRLNIVMLIVLLANTGRCAMLISEAAMEQLPLQYGIYTVFIKYLPFFVGNLVLIRLMSWSNDNEGIYSALSTSGEEKEEDDHANRLESLILNENGSRF